MTTALEQRSQNKCELCSDSSEITVYTIPPKVEDKIENQIALCSKCKDLINSDPASDVNHWRCLNDSMWSEALPVQVMAYRLLTTLQSEDWAMELKNMMYLDESSLEWAESGGSAGLIHLDSNGNRLSAGDNVTLIQDLNVKGANFTAKRGTAVRRIRLVHDNPEHIEGKVDGQQIVILTKYVKKL